MEAFATFVYANFVRELCFHCSDVLSLTSSKVLPPGVFLRISPFLQKGGMPGEGLGMPFCASRGFSSPSARLGPAGGVGESLVARSVRATSVHSWTGVALVRRTPATFYVRLALPPHLCTFDEVMGWESGSEC